MPSREPVRRLGTQQIEADLQRQVAVLMRENEEKTGPEFRKIKAQISELQEELQHCVAGMDAEGAREKELHRREERTNSRMEKLRLKAGDTRLAFKRVDRGPERVLRQQKVTMLTMESLHEEVRGLERRHRERGAVLEEEEAALAKLEARSGTQERELEEWTDKLGKQQSELSSLEKRTAEVLLDDEALHFRAAEMGSEERAMEQHLRSLVVGLELGSVEFEKQKQKLKSAQREASQVAAQIPDMEATVRDLKHLLRELQVEGTETRCGEVGWGACSGRGRGGSKHCSRPVSDPG